ncbi:relaxase domain-containing protein [Streptomyces sp. AGS-58]|uniref:relaxase domain-containing protein n=1 Tax=unclassified Streptomyces TaxID=2593676 RepID=UPI0035A31633
MISMSPVRPGNGWRYLFRGVMVGDGHRSADTALHAPQDEAGVPPGVWEGRGLAALGLNDGDVVTERQAELLLGEGRHPDADRIERGLLAQGKSPAQARRGLASAGGEFDADEVLDEAVDSGVWVDPHGCGRRRNQHRRGQSGCTATAAARTSVTAGTTAPDTATDRLTWHRKAPDLARAEDGCPIACRRVGAGGKLANLSGRLKVRASTASVAVGRQLRQSIHHQPRIRRTHCRVNRLVVPGWWEPADAACAHEPISEEEEQILALCMRGVQQFEDAWWVMGKSMANINNRRLYRKTHANFEDFARDVFKKSRPIAYEEMTAYAIGELLSARADTPSIGKKAAGALNPITKDYGAETSVAVHETIQDATGKTVTVKAITGIVQQFPRKEERELTQDELTALVREVAANTFRADQEKPKTEGQPSALDTLRSAVTQLEAAHRALAPANIKKALEQNADETAKALASAKTTADKAVARINAALPRET